MGVFFFDNIGYEAVYCNGYTGRSCRGWGSLLSLRYLGYAYLA